MAKEEEEVAGGKGEKEVARRAKEGGGMASVGQGLGVCLLLFSNRNVGRRCLRHLRTRSDDNNH